MTHKEKALEYFGRKFHCSQAVLAAFAPECGLTEEQALKLGACFGSGMRKGEVCGACAGALMVLGALYGQYDEADTESRTRANEVNVKMMDGFAKVNGSYICNDLLKCDVSTPEGVQYCYDNNLFTEFCPKMVANAIDVLEQIIVETDSEKIYLSEFCDVFYAADKNVVLVHWKKYCELEQYRKPLEQALMVIKDHPGCNYVADTRDGFEDNPLDTAWVADHFMPKAKEYGCKIIYFIIDSNNSLREELEGQENDSSDLLEFRYIYGMDEVTEEYQP